MITKSKKSIIKPLLSFNKLLIFPLCITYMIINFVTVINYFGEILYTPKYHYCCDLYYDVLKFCYNHGIDEYFYFFEDLGMKLSCTYNYGITYSYNNIISVILTLMMITDVIFSIKNGRKQIIKWILYGIITVIILFIGLVAASDFYDSV